MWNLFKVNKKDTRTTSVDVVPLLLTFNVSDNIVSAVDFEQFNAGLQEQLSEKCGTPVYQ